MFWPCRGWVSKKKKYLDRGVGGWVELYPIFFCIFGIFLTLQSPLGVVHYAQNYIISEYESVGPPYVVFEIVTYAMIEYIFDLTV